MAARNTQMWMWAEACGMLERAERMHRQFFQLQASKRLPAWEPPADVLETAHEVAVIVALPGIDPDGVQIALDDGHLVIAGIRALPPQLHGAAIHRLELPQGRFERRLALPAGRYSAVRSAAAHGCLVITLQKAE
jgi:HSP20 family molecular chaperone IbpA